MTRILRAEMLEGAEIVVICLADFGIHLTADSAGETPHNSRRDGGATHGYNRYSIRGNGIVSRTCSSPQIQATARSMPMPNPPWGTLPNLRRSRYHLNASAGKLCSWMRCNSNSCDAMRCEPPMISP